MIFKYEEILRLRRAHQAAAGAETTPRDALRALSHEFPGSLRELDRLPLEEIEARLRALRSGHAGPLLHAIAHYHERLREALAQQRRTQARTTGQRLSRRVLSEVARDVHLDEEVLRTALGLRKDPPRQCERYDRT